MDWVLNFRMQKFILAALICSVPHSAYPSEKGGNNFRSYELQQALGEFAKSSSCPELYDSKATMRQICDELGEEVYLGAGDSIGKRFYRQCCDR